tara:strand:- start:377 stop:832 length:456 start_codon:yes stop_codon:yes gene_type:complete
MRKKIFAAILTLYAVFGLSWIDFDWSSIVPQPQQEIIQVDKPSQEIIDEVKVISDIITDPSDRAKLAIFNYEFANRVLGYDTTSQQLNNVYALAGKNFFESKLVNKYETLSDELVRIFEKVLSTDNHRLSQDERQEIHDYFMGIAWVIVNK